MLKFLPEKEYLIKFAVDGYNSKYKKAIRYTDCTIRSIQPSYGARWGYRIDTLRGDDYVVLKLYINLGKFDRVDIVRVEVRQNVQAIEELGDEVYVITGEVAGWYYTDRIYRFSWIDSPYTSEPIFEYMSGDFFELMDGNLLMTMNEGA